MFWKKKVSKRLREYITYSGYEDIDGWIIIDDVRIINEPDDRLWKVVSTCGNLTRLLLILRRNSFSKYTFVVIPSCMATALAGRFIPGLVLFHLASMSIISWPFVSFFPCILYGASKFLFKNLSYLLSTTLPKSYYKIKNINNKDKNYAENSYKLDSYLMIIPSYFCAPISLISSKFKNPLKTEKNSSSHNFLIVKQIEDKTINAYSTSIENGCDDDEPAETKFIWSTLLSSSHYDVDPEFIPDYDERAAFILEEACETSSTSSRISNFQPKMDLSNKKDYLPDFDESSWINYCDDEPNKTQPSEIINPENIRGLILPTNFSPYSNIAANSNQSDQLSDDSSTSSYVKELIEKAGQSNVLDDCLEGKTVSVPKGDYVSLDSQYNISESLKKICLNFNESVNVWAKSINNKTTNKTNSQNGIDST